MSRALLLGTLVLAAAFSSGCCPPSPAAETRLRMRPKYPVLKEGDPMYASGILLV